QLRKHVGAARRSCRCALLLCRRAAAPPLLDRLARTLERITLAVDQTVDRFDQRHVFGPVIAPAAAALQRAEHRKLLLPIAQHVLLDAEGDGDLADRAQRVGFFAVVEADLAAVLRHAPRVILSFSFWLARKVRT